MEIEKELLSVKELSKKWGISEKTIYAGTGPKAKRPFPIPFRRVGRLIKFDIRNVEKFLNSNDG